MKGAVPGVLAAILGAGETTGADAFFTALTRQQPGTLDGVATMLGQNPRGVAEAGGDMLSSIIGGGRMGVFASKLKDYAGLPEGSSGSLLGVVGSMAMAAFGNSAQDRGLDATGVLRVLGAERDEIVRALPRTSPSRLRTRACSIRSPTASPPPLLPPRAATRLRPRPPRVGSARRAHGPNAAAESRRPCLVALGVGLAVLALLAWLLTNLLGREAEAPTTEAPAAPEAPATAQATGRPAGPRRPPRPQNPEAADPPVVGAPIWARRSGARSSG